MSTHLDMSAAAAYIRRVLGLTQRAAAEALGVTAVHLCNIERGRAQPSLGLIAKYDELWGVDLYVLAWCRNDRRVTMVRPEAVAIEDKLETWLHQQGVTL